MGQSPSPAAANSIGDEALSASWDTLEDGGTITISTDGTHDFGDEGPTLVFRQTFKDVEDGGTVPSDAGGGVGTVEKADGVVENAPDLPYGKGQVIGDGIGGRYKVLYDQADEFYEHYYLQWPDAHQDAADVANIGEGAGWQVKGIWHFLGEDGHGGPDANDLFSGTPLLYVSADPSYWTNGSLIMSNSKPTSDFTDHGTGIVAPNNRSRWRSEPISKQLWVKCGPENGEARGSDGMLRNASVEDGEVAYSDYDDAGYWTDKRASETGFDRFTCPGYTRGFDYDRGWHLYFSDIYQTAGPGAAARVEVTDSDVYRESKRITVCTVQSWSSTEVTAEIVEGIFHDDTLEGKHLWLTDANNESLYVGQLSAGPSLDATGETISAGGTATLSLQAQSVDTITVENLWTDWNVQVTDAAGATTTDDRVGQLGEFELRWESSQESVAPSLTISPPGDIYVGGTYAVEVTATDDGGSSSDTALIEISPSTGGDDGLERPLEPVVSDDSVYVAGRGREVQSFAKGSSLENPEWTFTRDGSGSPSSPVLDEERDQLYVGGGNGNLYAIDTETGEENWVYEGDATITSAPLLDSGYVYAGSNDGTLLKLEADSGNKQNQSQLDAPIYGQPAVGKHVYVLTEDGTLSAREQWDLDEDWRLETAGEEIRSSPIAQYASVYIATDAVYEVNGFDGTINWETDYGGSAGATPLYNGRSYVGDAAGTFYAFDESTGDTYWTYDAGSAVTSATLDDSGRILIGSQDGTIHGIAVSDESDVMTQTVDGTRPSRPVVDGNRVYTAIDREDGGTVVRMDRQTLGLKSFPTVDSVTQLDADDHGDPVFEVQGGGFGTKDQGPAVLYDFVDEAYENGNLNPFHGESLDNGQAMHTTQDDLQRVYDGASGPEPLGSQNKPPAKYISDETEQSHRHDGVDAHYRFRDGSYIGLPMAYGGTHEGTAPDMERRYERPDGKKQLYLAWWMRPTFDPMNHYVIETGAVDGTFDFGDSKRDRGERIRIPGAAPSGWEQDDWTGWIIGIRDGEGTSDNDDGRIEIEFDRGSNPNLLEGETIVGQESGATAEIPEDSDIDTFVSPQKLMRAWDSGGRTFGGFMTINSMHGKGNYPRLYWDQAGVPNPQEWNLLEYVVDIEEGWAKARVNFEVRRRAEWDPELTATPNSPTMQLIGMHTGDFGFNTFRISEVYQDSSVQRVVVADAETLEDASHYELQRPTEWSDGRVCFALNDGQLPTGDLLYVFVFDDQGQVNETGYPMTITGGE